MKPRFSQGHLPSCQTLATIGALLMNQHGQRMLHDMVSRQGDDYLVKFPALNEPVLVRAVEFGTRAPVGWDVEFCNRAITALRNEFDGDGYLWVMPLDRGPYVSGDDLVQVLEIAYARYQKAMFPERYADVPEQTPLEVYRNGNFHFQADESMRDFTGWTVNTLYGGANAADSVLSIADYAVENAEHLEAVEKKLEELAANRGGYVATACSIGHPASKTYLDPGSKINPWHDHVIKEVNAKERTIALIDPFNSRITMLLYFEDFFQYFYLIADAKVPLSS